MDRILDLVFETLLIVFGVSLILLIPLWAHFMFRLYVPKREGK